MGIKLKLIFIFIIIKVIPLVLITYLAVSGANQLSEYFSDNTKTLFKENKEILSITAKKSIDDSIKAINKKAKESLEKMSVNIANRVADFLHERDKDILFLSKLPLKDNGQQIINSFFNTKTRSITEHEEYKYDEKNSKWISSDPLGEVKKRDKTTADLEDNKKEFHFVDPIKLSTKEIPIYKEISYFGLKGIEIYKKSNIKNKKLNISKKDNTYCKAEDYFSKIRNLKEGDIYVSDVIGAYISSRVIGTFSKEKAQKMKVDFNPELHAYAGIENPKGKRFEGIIRFVTPVFENSKKVGYISFALDHRHIMEFTDSFNPINPQIKQNIADAGAGNYAFMWDYESRNISHPRDYFIVGFDPNTGERVPGWISKDLAADVKASGAQDLNQYLQNYPKFENQSLKQKPNISQLLTSGKIALDCRYLNFAPQCQGWNQVTKNGGYGSFIIYWSNVWKLTTAATIPYYTGQYGNTKRGFGYITIGANIDEFHKSANKTKENLDSIIEFQSNKMEKSLKSNHDNISSYIDTIINELSIVTIIMILVVMFIAILMSNYITNRINYLVKGTREFAENNLDYKIKITSNDEIGELEQSLNNMASKIKDEQKDNLAKGLQLLEQSKMASMGAMIGNIAHQWRQPLSVISTAASGIIISKEYDNLTDEQENKMLEGIIDNTQYLSDTIDTFRDYIKEKKELKEVILQDRLNNAINIVSDSLKNNYIKLINNIDDCESIKITMVVGELSQVVINIINNSKDVLLDNNISEPLIEINLVKNENNIAIITIEDNAGGIPDDILPKIFDPYFTTKHESQGTGLGLHMSKDIIEKHLKGKLYVKNINDGAKFFIELPLT